MNFSMQGSYKIYHPALKSQFKKSSDKTQDIKTCVRLTPNARSQFLIPYARLRFRITNTDRSIDDVVAVGVVGVGCGVVVV